jgi:DNA-binding transcriptional MerR regulator
MLVVCEVVRAGRVSTPKPCGMTNAGTGWHPRTVSGYRVYGPDAERVARFVKRAQQLGFALDDIEDLLHLAGGAHAHATRPGPWRTRIADLQQRIDELAGMRDALTAGRHLRSARAMRDCPIRRDIETLATTTNRT